MRVKYHGESNESMLIDGKEYDVIGIEDGLYRIIDEKGAEPDEEFPGYLYPAALFEIISGSEDEYEDLYANDNTEQ